MKLLLILLTIFLGSCGNADTNNTKQEEVIPQDTGYETSPDSVSNGELGGEDTVSFGIADSTTR
ncbi:hypothetical protein GCM10027051_30840 [Niabella terrae]